MTVTVCDTCCRIDCSTCNIPNADRNPGNRRKSVQIKDVYDVLIYDAHGNIMGKIDKVTGEIPKKQEPEEEPDWRNDYARHKEKEK